MEEETIEPNWIQLRATRGGYSVILYSDENEIIETHRFGQDLLGAVICAQELQIKTPLLHSIVIIGFPNKHPNQTTLDDI